MSAASAYSGVSDVGSYLDRKPRWAAYLVALVITALAIGARAWLDRLGEGLVPFSLFYPVLLLCTLFCGAGPGFAALILTGFAAMIFWLEPRGALAASGIGAANIVLFAVSGSATILLAHLLRSANRKLRRNEARLSLAQEVGRMGAWDLDLKTGKVWWSPSLYDVTGLDPAVAPSIEAFLAHVHPVDRDTAQHALEQAREGTERLDIEFRFIKEDGTTLWLVGRAELFRDARGEPSRLLGVTIDTSQTRTAERERDHANAILNTFFECLPGAAYAKDREGRILLGNPGFEAAVGHPPEYFVGKTDLELLADTEQATTIMSHDRMVMEAGAVHQLEEDLRLPDGRLTHWLSVKTPFMTNSGEVQGIVGLSLDLTARRKAEAQMRYLADEVDHRAKNLLALVHSVVRLTRVDDLQGFKAAISGRIQALSRAHSLLAASRWQGVDVATLLKEELAPFQTGAGKRISLSGPSVPLLPGAAQACAIALHELATNAAVHGALSAPEGRLQVSWKVEDHEGAAQFMMVWEEAGGPAVSRPERAGFGTTAIRGSVEHQLSGKVEIEWPAEGLRCRIRFPLRGALERAASTQPARVEKPASLDTVSLQGKTVLIVDDELLIALTLKLTLEEFGCEVMGPAKSADDAIALIRERAPDVAVLDVNLGGGSNIAVARALRALAVPYVFCTGYAELTDKVDAELHAEMLTKPTDPDALRGALCRALVNAGGGKGPG